MSINAEHNVRLHLRALKYDRLVEVVVQTATCLASTLYNKPLWYKAQPNCNGTGRALNCQIWLL